MILRISFRLEGGPMDGSELRCRPVPMNPEEPILYKLTKGPKDAGKGPDLIAQGRYFLVQRGGAWVGVHHPGDDDKPWHVHTVEQPTTKTKEQEKKCDKEKPRKRPPIQIPADSPAAWALKRLGEYYELTNQLKKPAQDGR